MVQITTLNIPDLGIWETRLYFEFTATNRKSGKGLFVEIFGPKLKQSAFFQFFSKIVEENFCQITWKAEHGTRSFKILIESENFQGYKFLKIRQNLLKISEKYLLSTRRTCQIALNDENKNNCKWKMFWLTR